MAQNQIDFSTELSSLIQKSEYLDLSTLGVIKIVGDQAETFLQGQFTCDVTQVTSSRGSLGALCNHQGRVLAVFWLLKKNDDYYCILPHSLITDFIQHLSKFAVFSKVTLEALNTDYFLYGCVGAASRELLLKQYDQIPSESFEVIACDQDLLVQIPAASSRYLVLRRTPLIAEEINNQDLSWKSLNIISGQAMIYPETKGIVTPHMLNLHQLDAVSFNKGCYVGQEIIARTHYLGKSKRHLCQAKIQAIVNLQPGSQIIAEGQEVGVLLESVTLEETTYLLAVIQDPLDRSFSIQGHDLLNYPV